jgi:tripartite-type tricarboxylate transporter receptor subunit TctC
MHTTKRYLLTATFTIGLSIASSATLAQPAFPNRPVRIITAGAPGGGSDLTTRAVAHALSLTWGHQVIVENRTGAAGLVAFDHFAKATPDGHTLFTISASHVINSQSTPEWPPDALSAIAPLSQASSLFYIAFCNPSVPVSTFRELLERGRANPNKVFFGTGGTGGLQHLGWEMIMQVAGVKFKHVAYKSAQAAVTAGIAGETHFGFGTGLSLRGHMAAGRARALAVTSRQRMPLLPDLPTLAEQGVPGVTIDQWYGFATNTRVPPAVAKRLSASLVDAIKGPDVVKRLTVDGSVPVGSTAQEFSEHVKSEYEKFRKLLQQTGLLVRRGKP